MNEIPQHLQHLQHLFSFDGLLHWCFLLTVVGFPIGLLWVLIRVLIPLQRLSKQAESVMAGRLPTFDVRGGGIREIERLRLSLQHMVQQAALAQERELLYRAALTDSQENERKRIAREIHDDTIQAMILVAHDIERAAQESTGAAGRHLENARQQLIQTIDNLRQMITDLRPTVLDELGLTVAIESLCDKYPRLSVSVVGEAYSIDHAQELALFRAAQEAVYNAERHANAQRISVTLTYLPEAVRLEVCDDGNGFAVPVQLNEFALHGHYGLIGLRERIQQIGGVVTVASQPNGGGTRVSVMVPFNQQVTYGTA